MITSNLSEELKKTASVAETIHNAVLAILKGVAVKVIRFIKELGRGR